MALTVIDHWMKEQVPYEVTIGKAPLDLSDEALGQKRTGLGWSSEEDRRVQALLEDEDAEIEGLVATHIKPPVRY